MVERGGAVETEIRDGLAYVRLARDRGNAIDDRLIEGLTDALHRAEDDPAVAGVMLGARGKLFSPGLDLQALVDLDRASMARFMTRFAACILQAYTFPKPMVAALTGHALAGGMILALTADWRVLRDDALVGLNELKVGVPLPFGVTLILREAVAGPRLEEVALFGRNYRGAEAVDAGLVHEACAPEGLESVATERLREMTSKDLRAFAVTKRYLRSRTVERIRAYDAQFGDDFLDCWFSEGTRGRIESLVADLRARSSTPGDRGGPRDGA